MGNGIYMEKKYMYADLTRPEVNQRIDQDALVVIPIGSTEQHGEHLPVNCDAFIAGTYAQRAAALATERGVNVLVAPTIPFGFSTHHLAFGGTISLRSQTLYAVLCDIMESLISGGVKRILFVNAHGGNNPAIAMAVNDVKRNYPETVLAFCHAAAFGREAGKDIFPGTKGSCHACEFETSAYLAFNEAAVRKDCIKSELPEPRVAGEGLGGVNREGVTMPFTMDQRTQCGVIGDATKASREKGEALTAVITEGIAKTMEQVAHCPLHPSSARVRVK